MKAADSTLTSPSWQAIAEASLLGDLSAALHGKLSPTDQQMMLRDFDDPQAPLPQKILVRQILEIIRTIPQWSNSEALQHVYQSYGHRVLFLQSFESSASYALLALRSDGQYQVEFNLDPALDVRRRLAVGRTSLAAFEKWIVPLSISALFSTGRPPLPISSYSVLSTKEEALRQLAWMLVRACPSHGLGNVFPPSVSRGPKTRHGRCGSRKRVLAAKKSPGPFSGPGDSLC